ncbi:MAG: DUF4097 family beta strand repeat protein [Candidatus Latescibacteria bacterium]|nr:DUF4097 family beta strand repeat protein [Candidatus Latescibacterota bacterium]
MQEDTINIRHLGLALMLYIMGPALILYGTFNLITLSGSQLVDWVMMTRPTQASPILSPTPQKGIDADQGTVVPSASPTIISRRPHPDGPDSRLALNSFAHQKSKGDRWSNGYTEPFERTVKMRSDGRCSVSNVSGNITVRTWDHAEIRIQAKKIAHTDDDEEGKEMVEQVEIEVEEHDGNVDVRTVYPERSGWWGDRRISVSVIYEVTVPERASVRLTSVSGSIDIAGPRGEVAAKAVSGKVVIADITSRVLGESVSGDVIASRLTGDAELVTVSGDVEARSVKGDLEARTTSGQIELQDVTAARLSAHSTSGTIRLEGPIVKGGSYDLETTSGGIRLVVPPDAAFNLRAQAFSGSIDSDLPVTLRGPISTGRERRRSLNGTVNGGGAFVTLSAMSGHIQIRTR